MRRNIFLVCATLIMLFALFISCENKAPIVKSFTVTFDTNGGSKIDQVTVTEGETISVLESA